LGSRSIVLNIQYVCNLVVLPPTPFQNVLTRKCLSVSQPGI